MCVRIEIPCNGDSLAIDIETVGVVPVGQVVEEVAHAAAHIKNHFRGSRRQYIDHLPAYLVRGEELSHLELFLGLGILVIAGKVGLPEVMQPADAGIAVVDALRGNQVLAGVYGKQDLLVDFSPLVLRYLLGNDCIHIFDDCW